MSLFNQISIIGVGLIGGSLAKAIKKNRLSKKVVGFFRSKEKLCKALRMNIVDEGYLSLDDAVRKSNLVIMALPVSEIITFMDKLKKVAPRNTVFIDIGSTKASICAAAKKLRLDFVGTHPLAGSEKRGADFSSAALFNKSLTIITPTKTTKRQSLEKIKKFWKQLGSRVVFLTPEAHDTILAFTSHLPHALAFSLINTIPQNYLGFGASGLKDTTRIALSDGRLWADILLHNRKALLQSLLRFENQLRNTKKAIQKNDAQRLFDILNNAQKKRETIR